MDRQPSENSVLIDVERRKKKYRFYDRALLRDYNEDFSDNFELALRGATFTVIFALPFLLHRHWDTPMGHFRNLEFFETAAAILIMYCFSRSVGESVSLAWGAVLGVVLAVLSVWTLNGIYPNGWSEGKPDSLFWTIAVYGSAAIFVVLNLDLSINCKMFFTISFCYHWMGLLTGGASSRNYATGFTIDLGSAGATEILAVSIGGLCAVLSTLIPEPLWAMDRARDQAIDLTDDISDAWNDVSQFFCTDHPDHDKKEEFLRDMVKLHHNISKLDIYTRFAWFECLGMGKWQQERLLLIRLSKSLHKSYDRLMSVMNAVNQEDFGYEHCVMMERLNPIVFAICNKAHRVMAEIVSEIVKNGTIRSERVQYIDEIGNDLEQSLRELMIQFRISKRGAGIPTNPDVCEELMDEHAFCISISGHGRNVVQFSDDVVAFYAGNMSSRAHYARPKQFNDNISGIYFADMFAMDVVFDRGHAVRALRRWLAVIIAFTIGYIGYAHLIPAHGAGIAASVAMMFSNHPGSIAGQNIGKLQGSILGASLGQIIYSLLGFCSPTYLVLTACALWTLAFVCLYLYYRSSHNAEIPLYMAAFGCGDLMFGCREYYEPNSAYFLIVDVVLAITITIAIDLLLSNARASDLAKAAIVDCWKVLTKGVTDFMDEKQEKMRAHKGTILRLVQTAEVMGSEAAWEPRYWRTEWKDKLFQKTIDSFFRLRMSLSGMEYEMSDSLDDGGNKDATFMKLLRLESFQRVRRNLLYKMGQLEKLFEIFIWEKEGKSDLAKNPDFADDNLMAEMQDLKELMTEVNASGIAKDCNAEFLNNDPAAEILMIVASMAAMTGEMRGLQHKFVRS